MNKLGDEVIVGAAMLVKRRVWGWLAPREPVRLKIENMKSKKKDASFTMSFAARKYCIQ
jgi:hypothetical protein